MKNSDSENHSFRNERSLPKDKESSVEGSNPARSTLIEQRALSIAREPTSMFLQPFSQAVLRQNAYAVGMHFLTARNVFLVPKSELQETQKTNTAKA